MTDIELAEIETRVKEATEGPWEVQDSCSWRRIGTPGSDGNILCPTNHPIDRHPDLDCSDKDLQFIAHARTDVPKLLAEVKRLRTAAAKLKAGPWS